MDILELYDYSSKVRRRFAEKLSELPWDKVIENKEASFYSMRNILLHMIDNEDWIVNWVIHNRGSEFKHSDLDQYDDMKQVIEHLDKVEKRTKQYFANVAGKEDTTFRRRAKMTLRSGKSFELSVEEILFQSFTEQLYHLGELIALLWQENIEPPQMQWFWNNPRQQRSNETS